MKGVFWGALLLIFSTAGLVRAEWVRVVGTGAVIDGDHKAARVAAREDALHQAALKYGAQVKSRDRLEMGRLTESSVDVRSNARVKSFKAISERVAGDFLQVTFDVDVYHGSQCESATASDYRKHVGILGFSLQEPEQAGIGGLHNIERGMSAALTERLTHSEYLLPHSASHIQLYDELVNAPTHETQQRTLSKAVSEARGLGVQFVVSGVIRNVALRNEKSWNTDLVSRSMKFWKMVNTERDFAVDLFIHDGFSGAILFEKRYAAAGAWKGDRYSKVDFMSPAFQSYPYGRKVQEQLQLMVLDIEASISCQPFMTRITKVEDKVILFEAGANAGISPGDKFQLYRSRPLYAGTRFQGTHLADVKQVLQVSQVQPEFSMGVLNIDPARLNIQEDDVLVRW